MSEKQKFGKKETKEILLKDIIVDDNIQQRKLHPEVIREYFERMEEGAEFPPVEVVYDGKVFWLWDGFHRIEATKKRNKNIIKANIQPGRKRLAIELSFSANAEHGMPRTLGDVKNILRKVLQTSPYKYWGKQKIADLVHCSRQHVYNAIRGLQSENNTNIINIKSRQKNVTYIPTVRLNKTLRASLNGIILEQVSYKDKEDDFEELILNYKEAIFGNNSIYRNKKKKRKTKALKDTIPDGFLLDLSDISKPEFYLVEVELECHPFKHILDQINRFFGIFRNLVELNKLTDDMYKYCTHDEYILLKIKSCN